MWKGFSIAIQYCSTNDFWQQWQCDAAVERKRVNQCQTHLYGLVWGCGQICLKRERDTSRIKVRFFFPVPLQSPATSWSLTNPTLWARSLCLAGHLHEITKKKTAVQFLKPGQIQALLFHFKFCTQGKVTKRLAGTLTQAHKSGVPVSILLLRTPDASTSLKTLNLFKLTLMSNRSSPGPRAPLSCMLYTFGDWPEHEGEV